MYYLLVGLSHFFKEAQSRGDETTVTIQVFIEHFSGTVLVSFRNGYGVHVPVRYLLTYW